MSINITINITEQQYEVLRTLHNPAINYRGSIDDRLVATEVIDDNSVKVYYIDARGKYFVESLEDGFGQGWKLFDVAGHEVPWN